MAFRKITSWRSRIISISAVISKRYGAWWRHAAYPPPEKIRLGQISRRMEEDFTLVEWLQAQKGMQHTLVYQLR